jgi:tetratricopeptide (TPR) repeat protein
MRGVDPRLATHLVACVTLAQGAQRDAFEAFVEKEAVRLRRPGADHAATVADVLEQLISDTGGLAPLLPDIIGEGFILGYFDGGIEGVLHCLGHLGGQGLQTIIRCAQDFSPHRPEPLQWLETLLEMSWNKWEFLRALNLLLPHNSLTLRSFDLRVTERLAECCADDPSVTPYLRGCAQGKLALACLYSGEHERALRAATDCLALFEGDAANSTLSDRLERALGDAYNTLALILDARQECDRALPAARRAVDFWRKIVPTPQRGACELAKALQILSRCLGQMGHFPQALESSTEVVRIQRERVAEHVGRADADLAEALLQHAIWQRRAGNSAAALDSTEEGVALYQRLASQQPDLHRAPFAAALRVLGTLLSELKQPEPAMKACAHAVRVLRDLDDKHPEAFRSELAAAIQMLNVAQIDGGDLDAALKSAAEAVSLYRPLAARNPDDYGEMFATALGNLASMYDALGNEPQKAFELMKEVVGMYKDLLVRGHPGAPPAFLAQHLYRMIEHLDREHRDAQAIELLEQSIDLYRAVAAHDPDARVNLVAFLRQLTVSLCRADRLPQAMKVNRESIHIYRQLTAQGHDEFRPHLAAAAHLLASCVLRAEPPSCEESLTLSHEALTCVLPCFTRADPTVEQDFVLDICRLYYETNVRLQREPDRELLSTLKTTLESRGAAP